MEIKKKKLMTYHYSLKNYIDIASIVNKSIFEKKILFDENDLNFFED